MRYVSPSKRFISLIIAVLLAITSYAHYAPAKIAKDIQTCSCTQKEKSIRIWYWMDFMIGKS